MGTEWSEAAKQNHRTARQGGAFFATKSDGGIQTTMALAALLAGFLSACGSAVVEGVPAAPSHTFTAAPPSSTPTATATITPTGTSTATVRPSETPTEPASPTVTPSETPTASPVAPVESLRARVTVDGFLSCRYGPGPAYLYLDALKTGTNLILIGRTDGDNWNWVYVKGSKNNCWVHAGFITIEGSRLSLPIVYPGVAVLPRSPYYAPTVVLEVTREQDRVSVRWLDVPLRAGDEEDERMLHYVVEVWRCEGGTVLFEPLATNETDITFVDQAGCGTPSHGRIFVQEKHGFAGPAEIPWPY